MNTAPLARIAFDGEIAVQRAGRIGLGDRVAVTVGVVPR